MFSGRGLNHSGVLPSNRHQWFAFEDRSWPGDDQRVARRPEDSRWELRCRPSKHQIRTRETSESPSCQRWGKTTISCSKTLWCYNFKVFFRLVFKYLLRKLFSCMLKLSIFASFILFLNQLNFKISSFYFCFPFFFN